MSTYVTEPQRQIPVYREVDVVVIGGGPSGIMAARAAAQKGLKVMLIEQRGYLGGNMTLGLPILGFLGRKGNQIIKGLPQQFIDRLKAKGGAAEHKPCKLHVSLTIIDPEMVKTEAVKFLQEVNVSLMMYTFYAGSIMEGNKVKGIYIESKRGREAILSKVVIDCSGDGDVAYRSGVEFSKGDNTGGMQPPTLMFSMKGVNISQLRDAIINHSEEFDMDTMPVEQFREGTFIVVGFRKKLLEAQAKGYHIPVARTILITGLQQDEIWVNMTRVSGVDSTDPISYTKGEITAREQINDIKNYLIKFIPGFEEAWIDKIAPFMGIRESRVIKGEYILTAEDILSSKHFDDSIAVASYPVDIHHSTGGDCSLYWCDDCYDLPYRILVPKNTENLLVAGRCCSMTHEAMASVRVMSSCMALGEAAGRAAQIAIEDNVSLHDIDVHKLRQELIHSGAYLR